MRNKFCNPGPDGKVAKQVTVGKELQAQPAEGFADSAQFSSQKTPGAGKGEPSIPQAPIPSFPIKLVLLPEAEPRAQEFPFPRPPSPGWGETEAQTHGKSDFNPPFLPAKSGEHHH